MQYCSAITTRSLEQMKKDPSSFTIPCTIGSLHFSKTLCDLGSSINLQIKHKSHALSINKTLCLGNPNPITMLLLMADRTIKRPIGTLHDVLVRVESFILPAFFLFYIVKSILKCLSFLGGHSLLWVEHLLTWKRGRWNFGWTMKKWPSTFVGPWVGICYILQS